MRIRSGPLVEMDELELLVDARLALGLEAGLANVVLAIILDRMRRVKVGGAR